MTEATPPLGFGRTLFATFSLHALVVSASLAVPVLAPELTATGAITPEQVGYYSSLIYGVAMVATISFGGAIRRLGAVRITQTTLVIAALGLLVLLPGHVTLFLLSGLLIGIAYGPVNPAASHLLIRDVPSHRRSLAFSVKQLAVPAAGAVTGLLIPATAHAFGWQAALVGLAVACACAAVGLETWRGAMDADRDAAAISGGIRAISRPIVLVLRDPGLRDLTAASGVLSGVQFCLAAYLVSFLSLRAGLDLTRAGLALSTALGSSLIMRVAVGWLGDRIRPSTVLGGLLAAIALVLWALTRVNGLWSYPQILAFSVALGSTVFSWSGVLMAEVARRGIPHGVIEATAGTMFFAYLGAFFGPATLSVSLSVFGDFNPGLLVMVAATAGLSFWMLLHRPPAG